MKQKYVPVVHVDLPYGTSYSTLERVHVLYYYMYMHSFAIPSYVEHIEHMLYV